MVVVVRDMLCVARREDSVEGSENARGEPPPFYQSESRKMNKFKATTNKKMAYVNKSLSLI
jgi:hypothetical protein